MTGLIRDSGLTMRASWEAFHLYKNIPGVERAVFLENIAAEIEKIREPLVIVAGRETNLPEGRLNSELTRTASQLNMFADLLKEGSWVDASIDARDPKFPARADIRKMLVPVGPVIVFGASNFPFAFSTAGGDTASALAAGCTVVVKGHSAHAETSQLVFSAIKKAIAVSGMPSFTVQHVLGSGNTVGKELVMHPYAKGVGFTGSFAGGRALVDYSQQREKPIPVFAEMSSINPVVFYPDTLAKNAEGLAVMFAASISMGVGQFCTNPGILIGVEGEGFNRFLSAVGWEMEKLLPQKMLHTGICSSYRKGVGQLLDQQGLKVAGRSIQDAGEMEAEAVLASVSGAAFLANPAFAEELFGPFSLAVVCQDRSELLRVLCSLNGQLTSTVMATEEDLLSYADIIQEQYNLAGRIILNNAPTGVEVCASMVHGGPYPATTDARFTSVGSTAIRRWVRPLCLQGFTDAMLPAALKNNNPLGIMRIVNNVYTRDPIATG